MISRLGLIDNLFVLVLPGALSPWNLILFVNFFRNVPNEMLEAANIEGAGDYRQFFELFHRVINICLQGPMFRVHIEIAVEPIVPMQNGMKL